jgi:hypothetical protein
MRKLVPFVLIALAGCIGPIEEPNGDAGTGGTGAGNGSGGNASGGSSGSGGADGSGGAVSASGGQTGSGGRDGSGGTSGSGGSASGGNSSGGNMGSGGKGSGGSGSGGSVGSGGRGSGGAASGGATGSGGSTASGGAIGTGGRGSGGRGGGSAGMTGSGSGGTVAAVCTSNKMWTSGNGTDMRPGNDCASCHSFTIAGTVYPTVHEPNNCNGTAANGIKVVITGADGSTMTLTPSATSGNFYTSSAIKTPFSAKVTNTAGGSHAMVATQTKGNCNSCHSQAGANGAPGRITAP